MEELAIGTPSGPGDVTDSGREPACLSLICRLGAGRWLLGDSENPTLFLNPGVLRGEVP